MKVAIVSPQYPPVRGGIAEHVEGLAFALSKNNDVSVFSMAPKENRDIPFTFVSLKEAKPDMLNSVSGLLSYISFAKKVQKELCANDFDIIHSHSYGAYFMDAQNTVETIHSTWAGEARALSDSNPATIEKALHIISPILSRIEKKGLMRTKRVIAVSDFLRNEAIAEYALSPEKIDIVPNGISRDFFIPGNREKIRARHNFKDGDFVFMYLGRISPRKGIPLLLEAFSLAKKKLPKAKLLIVGTGDFVPEMNAMASRLGIAKQMLFVNNATKEELRDYYSACDTFVLPSLYETFGIVLLEAMAQKCPIIASDVCAIPSVAKGAAILFSPKKELLAKEMIRVANDSILRKELSEKAPKRAEEFLWENVVKKIETTYSKVLKE